MKQLIIYAHPNPLSFCHAIKDKLHASLKVLGCEVVISDLYEQKFNPILSAKDFQLIQKNSIAPDVKQEQDHILWADTITFIFPLWWCGMPAILKGYIDRVFSYGFAYTMADQHYKGLLQEKKFVIICTTGQPEEEIRKNGLLGSFTECIDQGIFSFCGSPVKSQHIFFNIPGSTKLHREKMLDGVGLIAQTLSQNPQSCPYF